MARSVFSLEMSFCSDRCRKTANRAAAFDPAYGAIKASDQRRCFWAVPVLRPAPGLKRAVAQGVKLGRPKIDSTTERKKAACEGCWYLEGGQGARHRDWHAPAHRKRA
jgi:hypothetical protein